MNFVIPMAGRGQRFFDAGFEVPKMLIEAKGKILLEWSVDSLPLELCSKLIFVLLEDHEKNYGLSEIILQKYTGNYEIHFVFLAETTRGQAETVLLGLARGSGARSLSGMSEVTGKLLGPLLSVSRKVTVQFCKDEQIRVWNDPQNKSLNFLRVRVRSKIIPFLEKQLGPGIAWNLIRSSDQLRQDDNYLSAVALKEFKKLAKTTSSSVSIEVAKLEKLPDAILHRVLKESIDYFQLDSSRKHVLAVADLISNWHGQKPLSLPGIRVLRKDKTITFRANQEN
jgi:tRNA(Ile)-lysidine synthase